MEMIFPPNKEVHHQPSTNWFNVNHQNYGGNTSSTDNVAEISTNSSNSNNNNNFQTPSPTPPKKQKKKYNFSRKKSSCHPIFLTANKNYTNPQLQNTSASERPLLISKQATRTRNSKYRYYQTTTNQNKSNNKKQHKKRFYHNQNGHLFPPSSSSTSKLKENISSNLRNESSAEQGAEEEDFDDLFFPQRLSRIRKIFI